MTLYIYLNIQNKKFLIECVCKCGCVIYVRSYAIVPVERAEGISEVPIFFCYLYVDSEGERHSLYVYLSSLVRATIFK